MLKESTRKDKFVSGQKKPPNVFKECVRGLNSEKQFITSDLFFFFIQSLKESVRTTMHSGLPFPGK